MEDRKEPVAGGGGAATTADEPELTRLRLQARALEAAANAVVITDREGTILWVNPAFEWLTGYSAAEAVGESPRLLKSGEHPDDFYRELWQTLHRGQVWHGVLVNRRKDGKLYSERMTITPVTDDGGEVSHFIAIKEDVTAQEQAERELRESQRAMATLLGNLPGMAYRGQNDRDWTLRVVSDGCLQLTGYPPEDLIGSARLSFNDLIFPVDRPEVRREVAVALAEGRPFEIEYRITRADGELRWVWERGVGVGGAGGEVEWLEGFIVDVTERRRAEDRARATQARLAALVDLGRREVRDEQELVANALNDAVRLTGSAAGMFCTLPRESEDGPSLGQPLRLLTTCRVPEDSEVQAVLKDLACECAARRQPVRSERSVRGDGGSPMRFVAVPTLENGRVCAVAGVAGKPEPYDESDQLQLQLYLDEVWRMVERRRAEDALAASEERYRRFFDEDLTGDFITSTDGRILDCNPAFARMFGFDSPGEAMARPVWELYPGRESREAFLAALEVRGRLEGEELELVARDGRPVHVIANVVGRFDDEGALVEKRGYLFDITEHKRLEAQLVQAQKMDALGRLAGGIAHDFNNLLSVIMTFGGFLGDALDDEGARGDLEQVLEAARRGARRTEQLMEFARPRTTSETTDLNDVVRRTESMMRRVLGEDVRLEIELAASLPEIRCDHGQVEQVLTNLVLNARDAMPEGGVLHIATSTSDRADGAPRVQLEVRDTGVGIEREHLSRLFEPFFTTKPKGSGTGLGLATAYGIVAKHGGDIRVDSAPGRGASFVVRWPAVSPAPSAAVDGAAPRQEKDEGRVSRATVLVVEDDGALRSSVVRALETAGHHVLAASGAGEARLIAERHPEPIDLLLSDVVMPHMRGPELAELVVAERPGIRVLFMTGYADDETLSRLGRFGADRVLHKPFTPDQLRERVRLELGRAPGLS